MAFHLRRRRKLDDSLTVVADVGYAPVCSLNVEELHREVAWDLGAHLLQDRAAVALRAAPSFVVTLQLDDGLLESLDEWPGVGGRHSLTS